MSSVATRLLSLIMLLQNRPRWKAGELAEELDVSERTIHRYMGMLDEMGIPIYSERGPYGGFSLVRGYKLPPLIFGAEEATVLYMGAQLVGELWGRTYADAATSAMAKLDNVLPDELCGEVAQARKSLVVGGLTVVDYRPWHDTLHLLRQCIADRRRVTLSYQGKSGAETTRTVSPYALALQWGRWYLVGRCHLRENMRTFRVDRIQQLERGRDMFEMPPGFSVREYLADNMVWDATANVLVRIEQPAADELLRNAESWMEVTRQDDGAVTVQFPVSSFEWVTGWVLGFGPLARVLEPPELMERIVSAARGAIAQYVGRSEPAP